MRSRRGVRKVHCLSPSLCPKIFIACPCHCAHKVSLLFPVNLSDQVSLLFPVTVPNKDSLFVPMPNQVSLLFPVTVPDTVSSPVLLSPSQGRRSTITNSISKAARKRRPQINRKIRRKISKFNARKSARSTPIAATIVPNTTSSIPTSDFLSTTHTLLSDCFCGLGWRIQDTFRLKTTQLGGRFSSGWR